MTRQEEIEQQTFAYYETCSDEDIAKSKGFIDGANWADNHPRKDLWDAEKVCKWISERIGIDQKIETNSDGEPLADSYIAYCIARKDASDTIIEDLRKAMED